MGKFNFFTMGLFVIIAYMTTFLVKRAEQYVLYKHGVKKYAAQGKCLYMCAYLVLIFFCVIHNVDMYPKYPSENTIDMHTLAYRLPQDTDGKAAWLHHGVRMASADSFQNIF